MMQTVANYRMRILLVAMTVITHVIVMSACSQSEAGPIIDWLRRCRAQRQARRLQRQAAQQWTANYAVAPNCAPTQHTTQRVVLKYVPQTQYRTIWSAVPVTQYRPYTTTLPSNGCSVTCMRPCTTYSWQARRVPYTTYRPVYSTITVNTVTPPACNACPTPSVSPVATPTASTLGYASPNAFSPGCNGCGTTTQPWGTQPFASTPYTSQPSQPYTSQPMTTQPYSPPPATSPGVPPMTTPGNSGSGLQTPSLDPEGARGAAQGSPSETQRQPLDNSSIQPPANPTNSSSYSYPNGTNATEAGRTNTGGQQQSLQPIPYPGTQRDWAPAIPRLLNSPPTTARRSEQRYAAVRISWPSPARSEAPAVHRRAVHEAPLTEAPRHHGLDDGGWTPSFR